MLLLRILLFPFAFLYGLAIGFRNLLYKSGIINRTEFDIPIICVGNLSAGGTGKTPHIEFLIRKLSADYAIAVLSRGYMRKTRGYIFADHQANASTIGDEPYQIHQKFPNVPVGVSENRVLGIPDLLSDAPDTQLVLMDDGFQHLPIKAGFNIILTSYNDRFTKDWLLPSGRLREFRSAYKRADIIVITKCPENISSKEQQQITKEINPLAHQLVLFSFTQYSNTLIPVFGGEPILFEKNNVEALAFSGIANAKYFESYLNEHTQKTVAVRFGDHHHYTAANLKELADRFRFMQAENKLIITTEKDAVKLKDHADKNYISSLPIYYLPIEVAFAENGESQLIQKIKNYVTYADQ
jgi:tetraacyldisaccharide 4'-kinase